MVVWGPGVRHLSYFYNLTIFADFSKFSIISLTRVHVPLNPLLVCVRESAWPNKITLEVEVMSFPIVDTWVCLRLGNTRSALCAGFDKVFCCNFKMAFSLSFQNTVTNADKLLAAADELAQTGECDANEIYGEARLLEERMHAFLSRVERRRNLLDMSVAFYTHVKEVSEAFCSVIHCNDKAKDSAWPQKMYWKSKKKYMYIVILWKSFPSCIYRTSNKIWHIFLKEINHFLVRQDQIGHDWQNDRIPATSGSILSKLRSHDPRVIQLLYTWPDNDTITRFQARLGYSPPETCQFSQYIPLQGLCINVQS